VSPDGVTEILRHLGRLDAGLARLEGKQDAADSKLDEIHTQVKKTNGRVSDLEISRATERGAALQRAATIEEVRVTRASDLARNAWIRPGLVAVFVVVMDTAIRHYL
jgi:hypothetical protein